jgi:hypothetical protein
MEADPRSEAAPTPQPNPPTRRRAGLVGAFLGGVLAVLLATSAIAFASSWVQYRPPWVMHSAYSAGYEHGVRHEAFCSDEPTGHTGCAMKLCGTAAEAVFDLTRQGQPPRDMLAYEQGCQHGVMGLPSQPPSFLSGED